MTNPFLTRGQKEAKQSKGYWRSRGHEKDTAKKLSLRQISGSGSGRKKGDAYSAGLARVECKTTEKKSFSITQEMLDKISNAGLGSEEVPIIAVEFMADGRKVNEVAVIPMWALVDLMERARGSK